MAVGRDGRSFDDGPAERSLQYAQSPVWLKWIAGFTQDVPIAGLGDGWRKCDAALGVETRFNRIIVEIAPDGLGVAMQ